MEHQQKATMSQFECVNRFQQLPLVETAVGKVGNFYHKLKRSNSVMEWALGTAEAVVEAGAGRLLSGPNPPLHLADSAICASLSALENSLPAIKKPTDQLMAEVRELVRSSAEAVTRPVLRRASSVREVATRRVLRARELGLHHAGYVISTPLGAMAATGVEKSLGVAEHLLDTYLPPSAIDDTDQPCTAQEQDGDFDGLVAEDGVDGYCKHVRPGEQRAHQAVQRVEKLTRNLQRRLTQRTVAKVKSLHEHAADLLRATCHLLYMAVFEPRTSITNVAAVWVELSSDEPENQSPPQTFEQRAALLTREGARRFVHVSNSAAALVNATFATLTQLWDEVLHSFREAACSGRHLAQFQARARQLASATHRLYVTPH